MPVQDAFEYEAGTEVVPTMADEESFAGMLVDTEDDEESFWGADAGTDDTTTDAEDDVESLSETAEAEDEIGEAVLEPLNDVPESSATMVGKEAADVVGAEVVGALRTVTIDVLGSTELFDVLLTGATELDEEALLVDTALLVETAVLVVTALLVGTTLPMETAVLVETALLVETTLLEGTTLLVVTALLVETTMLVGTALLVEIRLLFKMTVLVVATLVVAMLEVEDSVELVDWATLMDELDDELLAAAATAAWY